MSAFAGGGAAGAGEGRNLREVTQRRFVQDVIGCTPNWKVLVLDDNTTRIISSVLTMYDIMEQRVTIVEKLNIGRQPFPEMEAIYFISPTLEATRRIVDDFATRGSPKYGSIHIFYSDTVADSVIATLQADPNLVARIKTLKELNLEYLAVESSTYHFDMQERSVLTGLYGPTPDASLPLLLGRKLATLCISLGEHPSIRYQGTSRFARAIAETLNQTLVSYKRANPAVKFNGDDAHEDRDRGQLLILDRSFDPVAPLVHEFTYQTLAQDLVNLEDGNIYTYNLQTGKGSKEMKSILGEADEFWVEHRYMHISKVIDSIRKRLDDIISTHPGASMQSKEKKGQPMDIGTMAAAVRALPEYQQTMAKISMHRELAAECMQASLEQGLLTLSDIESLICTEADENGVEVTGAKLVAKVAEALRGRVKRECKLRILAIFICTHRGASAEDKRTLITASGLSGDDQAVLTKFERLCVNLPPPVAAAAGGKSGGFFSSMFGKKKAQKFVDTPEGSYIDTRYVVALKGLLESLLGGTLPADKYPALGPTISSSAEAKGAAKSVRRFGANSRWGKKDAVTITGGRYMVFVAGGVSYSELRTGYELQKEHSKEVIVGGTHLISPDTYVTEVRNL